jgi:hypothetical protein
MSDSNNTLPFCPKCPYLNRCVDGECIPGTTGAGCADCSCGYFQVGQQCLQCPNGIPVPLMAVICLGIVIVLKILWRVSRVRANGTNLPEADAAVKTGYAIANSAVYFSIVLQHLQFSFLTFQLPFGFPVFLIKFANWASSLFNFDFATITSPECNLACDTPEEMVLLIKTSLTHGIFLLFVLALAAVRLHPKSPAHIKYHSINAMIAMYTLSFGTLIRSCLRTIDCSFAPELGHYVLDASPTVACSGPNVSNTYKLLAVIGILGLVIYCAVVPGVLYVQMRRARTAGNLRSAQFLESHGWILLRYTPNRWFFEFFILAYKFMLILAAELWSSSESAGTLLGILIFNTLVFMVVVIIDKPFVDTQQDHDKWTTADTSMVVVLIALLLEYGIGGICWFTTVANPNGARPLTAEEDILASILTLGIVSSPLAYFGCMLKMRRVHADLKAAHHAKHHHHHATQSVHFENPLNDDKPTAGHHDHHDHHHHHHHHHHQPTTDHHHHHHQ